MAGRITIDNLSDSLKEYLNGLGLTEDQVNQIVANALVSINEKDVSQDEAIAAAQAVADAAQAKTDNNLATNDKTIVGAINELFQSGVNVKENLVEALIAHGITEASTSMSWSELNTLVINSEVGLTEEEVQILIDNAMLENVGNKESLLTTDKTNLVAAINEVFQSGNSAKQEMVAALVAKGLEATTDMSFNDLIEKISSLVKVQGTAVAANVLSGKTFINSTGELVTGTMTNNGSKSITPNASTQTLPAGYYSGVTINGDSDLKAANIVSGRNIFGVTGTLKTGTQQDVYNLIKSKLTQGNWL